MSSNYSSILKNTLKFLYTRTSTFGFISHNLDAEMSLSDVNFSICVNRSQTYKSHLLVKKKSDVYLQI